MIAFIYSPVSEVLSFAELWTLRTQAQKKLVDNRGIIYCLARLIESALCSANMCNIYICTSVLLCADVRMLEFRDILLDSSELWTWFYELSVCVRRTRISNFSQLLPIDRIYIYVYICIYTNIYNFASKILLKHLKICCFCLGFCLRRTRQWNYS